MFNHFKKISFNSLVSTLLWVLNSFTIYLLQSFSLKKQIIKEAFKGLCPYFFRSESMFQGMAMLEILIHSFSYWQTFKLFLDF